MDRKSQSTTESLIDRPYLFKRLSFSPMCKMQCCSQKRSKVKNTTYSDKCGNFSKFVENYMSLGKYQVLVRRSGGARPRRSPLLQPSLNISWYIIQLVQFTHASSNFLISPNNAVLIWLIVLNYLLQLLKIIIPLADIIDVYLYLNIFDSSIAISLKILSIFFRSLISKSLSEV